MSARASAASDTIMFNPISSYPSVTLKPHPFTPASVSPSLSA